MQIADFLLSQDDGPGPVRMISGTARMIGTVLVFMGVIILARSTLDWMGKPSPLDT